MSKVNVQITVLGKEIYSGPFFPDKIYAAEKEALDRLADREGEDQWIWQYTEDAKPILAEVEKSSPQMQKLFWNGNGLFHGPGWLLLEDLEKQMVERFKLRYSNGVGAVIHLGM